MNQNHYKYFLENIVVGSAKDHILPLFYPFFKNVNILILIFDNILKNIDFLISKCIIDPYKYDYCAYFEWSNDLLGGTVP